MANPPRTNSSPRRPASAPKSPARPTPADRSTQAPSSGKPKSSRGIVATRFNLGKRFESESPNFYLLAGITLFTVILGLLMVLSASSVDSYLQEGQFFGGFGRQFVAAVIALPAMLFISQFPISFWEKWAWGLLGLSAAFQLLVFSPLGYESGGNRNWIDLGVVTAQPSEFIKLTVAIWLGVYLPISIARNGADNWRVLVPLAPIVVVLVLVLAGGDLGSTMIMFMIVIAALFFAGVALKVIAIPVSAGILSVLGLAITSPNRMARIMTFLNENCTDYTNACWQPLHGKWALANGGIFGVGLGQSKAKWSWLPAADNDYIFAIIGEELGMIGALVVIALFVALVVVFLRIIRSAQNPMVRIATGGIMVWIVGQAFINIGVVLGLFPVLGVPLPLLSSGGTALFTTLIAIGVVLSFTKDEPKIHIGKKRR